MPKEVQIYEGEMVAPGKGAANSLSVRITKAKAKTFVGLGRRVRITVETIDENETFEDVLGAARQDEVEEIEGPIYPEDYPASDAYAKAWQILDTLPAGLLNIEQRQALSRLIAKELEK